jgi:hypothetical protein
MKPSIQRSPASRFVMASLAVGVLLSASCAGGGAGSTSETNSSLPPPNIPSLIAMTPTGADTGSAAVNLTLSGSNFASGAFAQWNGTALQSSWVSTKEITATVPATDLASVGTAEVTVVNPNSSGGTSSPQTFTILATPPAPVWVKLIAGVSTPQDLAWDSIHGLLYVSIASTDTVAPNTIIPVNPFTAMAGTPVSAGSNPDLLSISADSSYLWAGLDGAGAVQRFLLPGLTPDISFQLPLDPGGLPQQAVSLEAEPGSPHTVGVVPGHVDYSPPGDGVYIYDDATPRPTSVTGYENKGPMLDWVQWGANNSVMYGSRVSSPDGVATLNVTASGVSLDQYNGGPAGPEYGRYDSSNGVLYWGASAYNAVTGGIAGGFDLGGDMVCTADPSLGRYYCVRASGQVGRYELWVFDLNSYTVINRVVFQSPSLVPNAGQPWRLIRWGNAGLAVMTRVSGLVHGSGGLFLIDGTAINSVAPDFSTGIEGQAYSSAATLTPSQVQAGSGNVTVTITGSGFTPLSAACLLCDGIQNQYLPTTYINAQQLTASVPSSAIATAGMVPISIFDYGTNLASSESLTLAVVPPPTGSTQVTALNMAGLAMDWDANSGLLYVATYVADSAYPNSIVAVNGETGTVVRHQFVGADPDLVAVSAKGQFLYTAFANATTETQLQLPGLGAPLTWTLNNPAGTGAYWAGDLRTAPTNPDVTAVNLIIPGYTPSEQGGVVIYDDNTLEPDFVRGWGLGPGNPGIYDTLAWGASDQTLTAACNVICFSDLSPLYELQVTQLGALLVATGTPTFSEGEIHSDFGTGLIYSDDGNVADPSNQTVVGSYNASGLVAPDSTLNRVFILGQTAAQANTSNYTIESFDEKGYALVSAITLQDLIGAPFQLVRWGSSGLAVLTTSTTIGINGLGSAGMLYLIQDTSFVSSSQSAAEEISEPKELVQRRWTRPSKSAILKALQIRTATAAQ